VRYTKKDMGQALYRKYRSRALSEVVGQEHITETLQQAIDTGRISHAYLFTGPRGTGKTSVARILAHAINQLPYTDNTHLDIIEIDAASNRRIDDIRDLREKIHIAPTSATYKVYIIDEVHMLTGESFNALLKTLEEPPEHVVFILATTEVHKLPATIVSRTQRYSFRPMDQQKGLAHLKHIATQEGIAIDDDALRLVIEHGAGSFRDSLSLLDQLANVSEAKITTKTVEQTLGLAPQKLLEKLLEAILKSDYKTIIELLAEVHEQGATTSALLPQLLKILQANAISQPELFKLIDDLLTVPRAYNPTIKLLTTLVAYTLERPVVAQGSKPTIAQIAKPIIEISKTPAEIKKQLRQEAPTPTVADSDIQEITHQQWSEIIAGMKNLSPPLSSILSHIEPRFDAITQTLTLATRFKLHLKKLEDTKAKQFLTQVTAKALGGSPRFVVMLDETAKAVKQESKPAASLDETSQSVVNIMGGGELVHE
jgi:DNA polymerase-3 subunit gamma/tau